MKRSFAEILKSNQNPTQIKPVTSVISPEAEQFPHCSTIVPNKIGKKQTSSVQFNLKTKSYAEAVKSCTNPTVNASPCTKSQNESCKLSCVKRNKDQVRLLEQHILPTRPCPNTCFEFDVHGLAFGISNNDLQLHPPTTVLDGRHDISSLLHENRAAYSTRGDGNCFFRSVSKFFFGHEEFHEQIRASLVNFMRDHPNIFSSFTDQNFEIYLQEKSCTEGGRSTWGTHTEIFALATKLQCQVYVFTEYGGRYQWTLFSPLFACDTFVQIPYVSILHLGDHYETIRNLDFCLCSNPPPKLLDRPVLQVETNDIIKSQVLGQQTKPSTSTVCQTSKIKQIGKNPKDILKNAPEDCNYRKANYPAADLPKNYRLGNIFEEHSYFSRKSHRSTEQPSPRKSVFEDFQNEILISPSIKCQSCLKLFYPSMSLKQLDLSEHANIKEMLEPLHLSKSKITLCTPCNNALSAKKIPAQSILNNLSVPQAPQELQDLNSIEQRLICRVHPYMKLILLPYGQSAMNGQSINFPYDLEEMVQKPVSSDDMIIVTTETKEGLPKEYVSNMKKVKNALMWLKCNNPLYSDVNIDNILSIKPTVLTMSQAELAACSSELGSANSEESNNDEAHDNIIETGIACENPCISKINYASYLDKADIPNYKLKMNTNQPVNMFTSNTLEQLAFPTMYPNGQNGLKTPRTTPLTTLKYFQCRLMSVDRRWSSNLPYLFWATNVVEKKLLSDNISIAMKMRSSKTSRRQTALNVGTIKSDLSINPDFPENYYGFMKNIRGSPAYWNSAKLDLNAMIKELGPPTWFLTLSANDMNWPDLIHALCQQEGISSSSMAKMTKGQKIALMNSNPILTARHFSHRVHHFITKVLTSKYAPIGNVLNYFWRIEFQMRGSPHIHSLWWIEGAPDLNTEEGRAAAPFFIDQYITTHVPSLEEDQDLRQKVTSYQTHRHTQTCRKYGANGQHKCRFDFPQLVTDKTTMKNYPELLSSARCYTLKREKGAENINAYNPILLREWGANMDIQFVGSAHGAAAYVCSYICKKESDFLKSKLTEVQKNLTTETKRQKLMKLGNVFLTHRQLSAQEAAFKMCSLPLRSATSDVIYLDIKPKHLRSRILLPSADLNEKTDDSTDVFVKNVFDRYSSRPSTEIFNDMSLHEFVSWYSKCQEKNATKTDKFFKLQNGLGFIRKRTKPAIIRTPNIIP